jgi:hypothetical protein
MDIKPIHTSRDHKQALKEIESLMMARKGLLKATGLKSSPPWWKTGSAGISRSSPRIQSRPSASGWSNKDLRPTTLRHF